MKLMASFRQLMHPREFRIAPPRWPKDLMSTLQRLAHTLQEGKQGSRVDPEAPTILRGDDLRFLADVGTGLWRLRQKMIDDKTGQPLAEMRRAYRHLESTWDSLTQAGLQVQDHTDTPFDSGLSLRVLAFQETPGIEQERVIETIKPSIYFKRQQIQMGEVIVGTKVRSENGS